jgi:hypothetical protein
MKKKLSLAYRIFVKNEFSRPVRKTVPPITLEQVMEIRAFFPLDKFFIFGHARSGTTILARLVRLHPQVHCNWQAHFFTRQPLLETLVADPEIEEWLSRRDNRWNQGVDLSPFILRVSADFIMEREARQLGKIIVGDKSPNSLMNGEAVRLLSKVYPDGKLIYIVRDGRDTVLSHRFQAFIDTPDQLNRDDQSIREAFIKDPEPFLSGQQSIFTEKGISRAAEEWVPNVQETDSVAKELLAERYFSLRYEDLLAQPWNEMGKVWQFLGASTPQTDLLEALTQEMNQNLDADWQQEKAEAIARSLHKGKHGSWRDFFTLRDIQIFESIAGKTLRAWSYES